MEVVTSLMNGKLLMFEILIVFCFVSCSSWMDRWDVVASSVRRNVSVRPTATSAPDPTGCQSDDAPSVAVWLPAHLLLALPVATCESYSRRLLCSRRGRRCQWSCRSGQQRRWSDEPQRRQQRLRSTGYLGNARVAFLCYHCRHSTVLPGLLRG